MNKKIMILGASILQTPAITKAKEMGLDVVVVDMNPDAIGFKIEGIEKEVISTIDIPKVVECAKKHNIDAIITLASDMPMRTVAAVCKELGLIGISEETAIKTTDKGVMRKALLKENVPIPQFFRINSFDEFLVAAQQMKLPFIVKPADNSGSRGVYLVEDEKHFEEAYQYSLLQSRNGQILVEEYMQGPEVSVETLAVDGICHIIQITDKITTGAPHFVEMGHSQPSRLNAEIIGRIKEITKQANKAVGITSGPSHTEIIVTDEGPKIVEIGARLGGDCITTHLVPLSTGIDMVEGCINIALGKDPDITQKYNKSSAIRYFTQSPGEIKNIYGLDEAEKISGVVQISVVHGVGEKITDISDSGTRIGFLIAQSDEIGKALKVAEQGMEKIKIEII